MRSGTGSASALLVLALIVALGSKVATGLAHSSVSRLDVRKWELEARNKASSAAKAFLEESGQALLVPIDVEVFLVGFDGDGAYAHKQDSSQLLSLVAAALNQHCPHSLETEEEIGVCFQLNWQVLGDDELGDEVGLPGWACVRCTCAGMAVLPSCEGAPGWPSCARGSLGRRPLGTLLARLPKSCLTAWPVSLCYLHCTGP